MADHAGDEPVGRLDQVLLLMQPGQDRDLLAPWLEGFSQYEVTTAATSDEIPESYDLCLLDRESLATHRAVLERRHRDADPAYLPHVLLDPQPEQSEDHEQIVATEAVVDEVLGLPMEKDLLRQRLENLLKARRSSVELSARQEQYRTLLGLLPEMVLLVDDGKIVYANDTAVRDLGSGDEDSLVGQSPTTLAVDEDRDALRSILDAATETEQNTASEFVDLTMETLSGTELYVSVTSLRVTFEGRPVTQLIIRDLTAQQQREKQLTLFGRAIDAAIQGITIADAGQDDEPLVYANAAFERITGYDIDETLGRNCRFLQGANTDEETVARVRAAIDAAEPVSVDILNYRNDGTAFWNRLDIVPVENERGEVTHFLGLQRDITEQKQSKQRLSVLNRILRHNLRNKLNVIQAYTDQLEAGAADPETATASINDAAAELLAVSDRVREFDSVVSASDDEMEPFDLVDLVEECLTQLRADAPATAITLTGPPAARVVGHPGLRAALGDLFVQLGRADQPRGSVEVSHDGEQVLLRVTDSAGGFSEHDLEVVERGVETPTEHLQGVALWLLRWATERSGGEMHAETDDGDATIELRFRRAE